MQLFSSKYFLWILLSVPALAMAAALLQGNATMENLLHPTGEFAARFMIVAMLATPLKLLFSSQRWPFWLLKNRRYFGVAAFGYALMHTVFYMLDMKSVSLMLDELWTLGIWTGWVAFIIFVPLAVTSNDASQKLLRRNWKKLQQWVYPAALLTLTHWIFVHNNLGPALVHFIPLAALEAYRISVQRKRATPVAEQSHL
ncbi:MAG: ferric reductase-like transmembrane domain-containing protein [Pseudomonadota bacterium]